MPLNTTEKQFESDIAAALLSPAGGYTRNGDCYAPKLGLFVDTLSALCKRPSQTSGHFFEKRNPGKTPVRKVSARPLTMPAMRTDCFRCCGMGSSTGDGVPGVLFSAGGPR